jgi:hypothetical protein
MNNKEIRLGITSITTQSSIIFNSVGPAGKGFGIGNLATRFNTDGSNNNYGWIFASSPSNITDPDQLAVSIRADGMTHIASTLEVVDDVSFGTNLTVDKAYIGSGHYAEYASFSHSDFKTSATNYACLQTTSGKTILNSKSGEDLHFRINNETKMYVASTGQVVIGDGFGFTNTTGGGTGYVGGNGNIIMSNDGTNGDEFARIPLQVGVGQTDTNNVNVSFYKIGSLGSDGGSGSNSDQTRGLSAFFQRSIIVDGIVFIYSDKRIKKDIIPIVDDTALSKLRLLNPCTYKYIDYASKGNDTVLGFIAQDVEEIIPHAVATESGVVNNVYGMADVSGNTLILRDTTFNNIESNLTDISGNPLPVIVQAMNKEITFDISMSVLNATTAEFNITELPNDMCVYDTSSNTYTVVLTGQYVNNLKILDKNAIWTVAAAATQEIDRQQQADKVRIAELETKVETLETQLTSVLARLTALENA